MNTIEQTVKTKKPKKEKDSVNGERKIVDSPLSRLWGLLEGKIFYESDDIFYSYRFNNQ